MKSIVNFFRFFFYKITQLDRKLDEIKINQALILMESKKSHGVCDFNSSEFKVFSQWGEDGIIQFLINNIKIKNKTFIEFGVEDFSESNCRFLLMKDLWEGYVIDGSSENINRLRSNYYYWKYPLRSKAFFLTQENIIDVLDESLFDKELGILSIDVDGIDYYLLKVLEEWHPSIFIVEYNAIFGASLAVTIPYDPFFTRNKAHYSNLYYGASLQAFAQLMDNRGYGLVGINKAGSNAFFVRRDLLNERVFERPVKDCFVESLFREARDSNGSLSFISHKKRREVIKHLPLVDTNSGMTLCVGNIDD